LGILCLLACVINIVCMFLLSCVIGRLAWIIQFMLLPLPHIYAYTHSYIVHDTYVFLFLLQNLISLKVGNHLLIFLSIAIIWKHFALFCSTVTWIQGLIFATTLPFEPYPQSWGLFPIHAWNKVAVQCVIPVVDILFPKTENS
jgi:hypothetical protein